MKLYKFRKDLKNMIQYELIHEHTFKELVSDPFIYIILFFGLSGAYVLISILLFIISIFVK